MTPRLSPSRLRVYHRSTSYGLNRRSCRLLFAILTCGFLTFLCFVFINHDDQDVLSSLLRRDVRASVSPVSYPWPSTGSKFIHHVHNDVIIGKQIEDAGLSYRPLTDDDDPSIFPTCSNVTSLRSGLFPRNNGNTGTKLRRFTGRKLVRYVSVYPDDETVAFSRRHHVNYGNAVIPNKVIYKLRQELRDASQRSHFPSGDLTRVERMTLLTSGGGGTEGAGRLFLLEINIGPQQRQDGPHQQIIEYLIDAGVNNSLCHPQGYEIRRDRKIYVIITVKNLGMWVQRMVTEFEELQQISGDDNFELIIADFNSTDIDLMDVATKSVLSSKINIMKTTDPKYNKIVGVSAAVNLVKHPDDIVFLCDLHLEIPTTFLDDIRKHVIRNKMVFAPVVGKLDKGSTLDDPQGQWDTNGFGLIAMTKSDWDMIGGINTEEFSGDQWGGEDWEMIDRIIESGLIVNRRRVPGLFHHYHDKTGMWPGGRYQLIG